MRSIGDSPAKFAWGREGARRDPQLVLFVYTAKPSRWRFGILYGPASTSVATDATPGPEPANAPVSNQMRPAFAVMRRSVVTPGFSSTTVPWRGDAAGSSSALGVMTFTGRPVPFARTAANGSTP